MVLKLSPEDLQKAKESQSEAINQDLLPDEVSNDHENLSPQSPELENEIKDIDETPVTEQEDYSSNHPLFSPKIEALSNRGKWKRRGQWKTTTKRPRRGAQASTASTSNKKVVEIAVFTDEKLYKIWQGR